MIQNLLKGSFFWLTAVEQCCMMKWTTVVAQKGGAENCKMGRAEEMKKVIMLQPSEWIIMEKLWENPPKTIMQLYHELKEDPGWSKSTVNTLLGRMVKKDIIYYEEGKKAKLYYPKAARDDAAVSETRSLIERVYQGSVGMMMSTLIRNHNLTDEDIRELYEILGEAVDKHD